MSFPRYEAYKDTGVEWLDEVPKAWAVCALSYRYEVQLGKMLDEKRISGEHLGPYLRNVDVQWDRINCADLPEMDFRDEDLVRFSLRAGDLLVCEGGEVGRAAIWKGEIEPCFYQKALHRLRPLHFQSDEVRFAYYLMFAAATLGVFSGSEGKATIVHLPAETLRRYRFPFPSLSEQRAIASFLDRETAKIDALVEEQQRLIALLKEKRQAVISHAVTKGLDPNAPMKNSGSEWLGEVPAHWSVTKIARHLTVLPGYAFPSEGFTDDETQTRLLRGINVGIQEIRWDETVYWRRTENDGLDRFLLNPGALVLGMDRPWIGGGTRIVRLSEADTPCLLLQRVAALFPDDRLNPSFVFLVLQSREFVDHFTPDLTGVSVPHVSGDQIGAFILAVPPQNEQAEIVRFLTTETERLDDLQSEVRSAIALLQERRSALISAAVTGKIDVRGLAIDRAEAA